jgi:GH24 family phage-related lysozyme (muramidase)
MKRGLVLFVFTILAFQNLYQVEAATCRPCLNINTMLTNNEGKRRCVYKDSLGIPTIGIGFNLKRSDARLLISRLGLKFEDVVTGRKCLTGIKLIKLKYHSLNNLLFKNNFNRISDKMVVQLRLSSSL